MLDDDAQIACWQVIRAFVQGSCWQGKVPEAVELPAIRDWVAQQHLGPVFLHTFRGTAIPGQCRNQWAAQLRESTVRYARSLSAASDLANHLQAADIPIAYVRGIAIAEHLYPSPELRPMTDIDVVMRPEDKEQLQSALQNRNVSLAKRLRSQFVYVHQGTLFEFHWSLLTPKRYRALVPNARLLQFRQPRSTTMGDIPVLRPELEIIGLCLHAYAHHDLSEVRHLVDLGLFLQQKEIDWTLLKTLCHEFKMTRMVGFALFVAATLTGAPLPPTPLSHAVPKAFEHWMHAHANMIFRPPSLADFLAIKQEQFWMAECWSSKLRQALRLLSKDELRQFVGCIKS